MFKKTYVEVLSYRFMAPRTREAVTQPSAPADAVGPTGGAPAQRSRTRTQTRTSTQDREQIDLPDLSDSEDEYVPNPSDHVRDVDSAPQEENSHNHINNPDAALLPKTTAVDVWYFFDNKCGEKVVCRECR
jgi:hypothetical protein